MRAGRLAGLLVGGLLLTAPGAASASTACPGDDQIPTAATAPDAIAALVCDINVARTRNGLPPVRLDARLQPPAQDLASDMAANAFLSHTSSDGRTTLDRIMGSAYAAGASSLVVLENVDWGSGLYGTPLATTFGWMKSDEHRAHMLDPGMQDIGVGIAEGSLDGTRGVFYVADFGTRIGATAENDAPALRRAPAPRRACNSRARSRHRVKGHLRRVRSKTNGCLGRHRSRP
jgi:uncharacterized protein YkwD